MHFSSSKALNIFPLIYSLLGEDMNCHFPNHGIPGKNDRNSLGEHRKFEKENQPCARTKNDHSTQSAKDYLDPELPEDGAEEKLEKPSSAPAVVKTERASHHHVGNKAIPVV